MKYLSLFSGYGGFELGINKAYEDYFSNKKQMPEQEGLSYPRDSLYPTSKRDRKDRDKYPTCIGFSEIDKYATQVYLKHFPYEKCEKCRLADERQAETTPLGDSEGRSSEQSDPSSKRLTCNCKHKPYGDITKLDPSTLPDFDFLCGGFPCQAFSIAGKRAGFEDTRGTLIYDVFRIIKEKHPKLVLLENVKGLLSHDNGRTFKTIITSLAELGYAVEWQVLNAKNFGVPQNRERVFIIGHLGGFGGRQVFPITGDFQQTATVAGYISEEDWPRRHEQIRRVYKTDGAMPTIPTGQGGGVMTKIVIPVLTPDMIEKRQNGRRFKKDGEPSFTLTGQDKHGVYDGMKIRRLTPTECERLMGLPDGWTEGVSDTQRYKLCGNGVVVNVVEQVVKKLIQ